MRDNLACLRSIRCSHMVGGTCWDIVYGSEDVLTTSACFTQALSALHWSPRRAGCKSTAPRCEVRHSPAYCVCPSGEHCSYDVRYATRCRPFWLFAGHVLLQSARLAEISVQAPACRRSACVALPYNPDLVPACPLPRENIRWSRHGRRTSLCSSTPAAPRADPRWFDHLLLEAPPSPCPIRNLAEQLFRASRTIRIV